MIRRHPKLSIATLVYLCALAAVTLSPAPVGKWASVVPLAFVANVVLFVPLGLFVILIVGRHRWVSVLLLGAVISCWIELAQGVWLPMRMSEPRDIIGNVTGTLVGIVVATLVSRAADRRAGAAGEPGAGPLTPISQSTGSGL